MQTTSTNAAQVQEYGHKVIEVADRLTGELIAVQVFKTSAGIWARKWHRGDEVGLTGDAPKLERIPLVEDKLAEPDPFHKYRTKFDRLINAGVVHLEEAARKN